MVLRGAKKLRVNDAFGGIFTAANFGTGLVDFLAVCKVLLDIPLASLYFLEVVALGR
jgi:hypothetical protein